MKPTIPEVLPKIREFRKIEGNECGGSLHIVLDDYNTDDDSVKFCIQFAKDKGDLLGAEIGELLLKMSRTQRRKLASIK